MRLMDPGHLDRKQRRTALVLSRTCSLWGWSFRLVLGERNFRGKEPRARRAKRELSSGWRRTCCPAASSRAHPVTWASRCPATRNMETTTPPTQANPNQTPKRNSRGAAGGPLRPLCAPSSFPRPSQAPRIRCRPTCATRPSAATTAAQKDGRTIPHKNAVIPLRPASTSPPPTISSSPFSSQRCARIHHQQTPTLALGSCADTPDAFLPASEGFSVAIRSEI